MVIYRTSYKYLVLSGLLLLLTTCSVEKNTEASRFYHGMTARYNIYFNGYESYKAGLQKITSSYKDDYAEILKIFEYSDPASATLCSSDMEKAIQKASKLITLKSITSKPEFKDKIPSEKEKKLLDMKEYNAWVDDSYLLIGKARFYKHEFSDAESVFNYCITNANDPLIKIEAAIWLARKYNETGNYTESLRLLSGLEITPALSKGFKSMYYTTFADLFIKQKRYSEAIDPLEKAINVASGKRPKYRFTYLLAQLYGQTGNGAKATALYRQVVKMNPPYDVEFNARINLAGVFDANSGNPKEIRKELEKMLKDLKNEDFHDQIYYALGNMAMKEGNEQEALDYFRKSAAVTTSNTNQKGRSYLALANYFYSKPDYMKAGRYYDSTVSFLDQKHPDFLLLKNKAQNLNMLVSQLTVIEREDSLLRVAAMPEGERAALISNIIAKVVKDESEGKTSDNSDRYNLGQFYENERRFQGNIDQEGKWYFYNQAALAFGRTEFRRRWGDRKPEDNWRRSNKARSANAQLYSTADETVQNGADTSKTILDNKKPEFYLKNLPLTDSAKAASNEKIAIALLNAGKAYDEKIGDPIKATDTFESLATRYPKNELVAEAYYNIYRINKDINAAKAETFREKLLEKYPKSEFALILSDPSYYEKKLADLKMTESLYQEAYNEYNSEKFPEAIAMVNNALEKYPKDDLVPKFMLLRAFSVARISDERNFRDELEKVIKAWPETAEGKKATELLAFINKKSPELKVEKDKEIAAVLYVADTTGFQRFALIIADAAFNINLATFDVISYNIDNYTNKNYRTEGALIDNKYIIITVSGFKNFTECRNYFNAFSIEKNVRNTTNTKMYSFVISESNLKVLNTDKDPGRYLLFFQENYLPKRITPN